MYKKILIAITVIAFAFASCKKINETEENDYQNQIMDLKDEESDDYIESHILKFKKRMDIVRENPEYPDSRDWNYSSDSLVWYIEATLNYLYVRYDYKNCDNQVIFDGSQDINTSKESYNIVKIQELYDNILDDWREKYHSIGDDTRTPIAFDINSFDEGKIDYEMIVIHGRITLDDYEKPYQINSKIFFNDASALLSKTMINHLNNTNIQLPYRTYFTHIGVHWATYPGPLNQSDPNPGDGFIENYFYYTSSDGVAYHLNLFDWEYAYHEQAYFDYNLEFLYGLGGADQISYSSMHWGIDGSMDLNAQPPVYPNAAYHFPLIVYGKRHYTTSSASTL